MTQATRDLLARANDGCHRYGWLLNMIVMALLFAYFMGGLREEVTEMKERLIKVESQVYDLSHAVRGLDPLYDQRKKEFLK